MYISYTTYILYVYICPVGGHTAPVDAQQRVLHHFSQQHPICTVLDARHTLHSRKWLLEQPMQLTRLRVGLHNGIVLLEACMAILPSSLWLQCLSQQMPVWGILT